MSRHCTREARGRTDRGGTHTARRGRPGPAGPDRADRRRAGAARAAAGRDPGVGGPRRRRGRGGHPADLPRAAADERLPRRRRPAVAAARGRPRRRARPPSRTASASRGSWGRRREPADETLHATAVELAGRIASGEQSAVEVTQAHLDRIEAVEPAVHAFLHVDGARALEAAAAVDAKRGRGEALGPLAGVPLALKDVLTMTRRADHLRLADPARAGTRPTTRRSPSGCWTPTSSSWARPTSTSSPWAPRPRTPPTGRPTTRGTSTGSPAGPAAARPPRWPRSRPRWPSAPTPAARSASRRRSPARSG